MWYLWVYYLVVDGYGMVLFIDCVCVLYVGCRGELLLGLVGVLVDDVVYCVDLCCV